jgi:hypothetical protein
MVETVTLPMASDVDQKAVCIPCPRYSKRIAVSFDMLQNGKIVDNEVIDMDVYDLDEIRPDDATVCDSIYQRTLPESKLIGTKGAFMNCTIPQPYSLLMPPTAEVAANYMRSLVEILESIRTVPTERVGDTLIIGNLLDVLESGEATWQVKGLLFFNMASRLGLEPFVSFEGEDVFIGIEVNLIDFDESDYTSKVLTITVSPDSSPCFVHTGRFLVAQLSEDSGLDDMIEAAINHNEMTRIGSNACLSSIEKERLEFAKSFFTG